MHSFISDTRRQLSAWTSWLRSFRSACLSVSATAAERQHDDASDTVILLSHHVFALNNTGTKRFQACSILNLSKTKKEPLRDSSEPLFS